MHFILGHKISKVAMKVRKFCFWAPYFEMCWARDAVSQQFAF